MIDGEAIDAAWMQEQARAILAAREAEQDASAPRPWKPRPGGGRNGRRQGFDLSNSIIEAVRERLDLADVLTGHGYKPAGDKQIFVSRLRDRRSWRLLLTGRDGVERVYRQHAADPLAADNLPSWCRAKAIDAVDVVAILDHGGDLKAALRTLAQQFGIDTPRPATATPEPLPHPGVYDDPGDWKPDDIPQPVAKAEPASKPPALWHSDDEWTEAAIPSSAVGRQGIYPARRMHRTGGRRIGREIIAAEGMGRCLWSSTAHREFCPGLAAS